MATVRSRIRSARDFVRKKLLDEAWKRALAWLLLLLLGGKVAVDAAAAVIERRVERVQET